MPKKHKYYYVLSLGITLSFILLAIFVFNKSYLRLGEAFRDLYTSAKYYFCEIFSIEHTTVPTVKDYSKIMLWDIFLPTDFENFKNNFVQYFTLLFSKDNFVLWGTQTSKIFENIGKMGLQFKPGCVILILDRR